MMLPLLRDVWSANIQGTVLTGLVQYVGRSIVLNYPLVSYNSNTVSQSRNFLSNFGSGGTSGKYTYGCVLRTKVTLRLQNLESVAVHTGMVGVPPLQTVSNNTGTDFTPIYLMGCTLAKAGSAGDQKTISCVVDLPKLYYMSDDQYQTLPALWFSNGGPPSTIAYGYHQYYRLDGAASTVGVNVTCDIDYTIRPTAININLTE